MIIKVYYFLKSKIIRVINWFYKLFYLFDEIVRWILV